jgi:hypothetical protein
MVKKSIRSSKIRTFIDGLPSVAEIDAALVEMAQERSVLMRLREAAAEAEGVTDPPPATSERDDQPALRAEPEVIRQRERQPPPTEPIKDLTLVKGSTADIVYGILDRAAGPVSYAELREEYMRSPAGKNMQPHEKPYYAGIQRLKDGGHVQIYKGRLFTWKHLKKFKEDVAAGRIRNLSEGRRFKSKWQDIILEHLRGYKDWLRTADVVKYMESLPEFTDRKHTLSQVCVALRHLNARHKLVEKKGHGKNARWRAIVMFSDDGTEASDGEAAPSENSSMEDLAPPSVRH